MKIKLAEALLRRKELAAKVALLKELDLKKMFEVRVKRIPAAEGIDEVTASVPKVSTEQITASYDYHARQLRITDAAIQQANWLTEVEVPASVLEPYADPAISK
jgi:hypothetical protein